MRGDDVEERVEAAGLRRRWMRRAMTTTAAGAAALLALSGCGPSEEELAAQAEEDQLAASLEVAWESDDELISGVREAEGVALAYVRDGDLMQLLARDIDTGDELWRKPALYGNGESDRVPSVATAEHDGATYASLYTTSEDGPGHHEVLEVETGEPVRGDLTQSIYGGRPASCGETFCVDGFWWYDSGSSSYFADESQEVAFDWDSERWRPREQVDGTENEGVPLVTEEAERYGSNLSISPSEESAGSVIGFADDGEVVWERPYAEVVGEEHRHGRGLGYTTHQVEDPLVLSAWGYPEAEGEVPLDSQYTTIRLDRETGETRWKAANLNPLCDYGGLYSSDASVLVACGYESGTRVVEREDDETTWEDQNVEAYVTGVDLETGDELWRVDIASDGESEDPTGGISRDKRYLDLPERGGETITVDVTSGESVTTKDAYEQTVFCWKERDPVEVLRFSGDWSESWNGEEQPVDAARRFTMFSCDQDEETPVDELPAVSELHRLGYEEDVRSAVFTGPDGMVAYEAPALEEFREDA